MNPSGLGAFCFEKLLIEIYVYMYISISIYIYISID